MSSAEGGFAHCRYNIQTTNGGIKATRNTNAHSIIHLFCHLSSVIDFNSTRIVSRPSKDSHLFIKKCSGMYVLRGELEGVEGGWPSVVCSLSIAQCQRSPCRASVVDQCAATSPAPSPGLSATLFCTDPLPFQVQAQHVRQDQGTVLLSGTAAQDREMGGLQDLPMERRDRPVPRADRRQLGWVLQEFSSYT